jgi:ArsR family transcriptional regulator
MADPLKLHKALADETRLRLVRLVSRGPLNVNELIEILRMGQSRISRHLKILADAGLVGSRREGTWVYYQAAGHAAADGAPAAEDPLVGDLLAHLHKHERALAHYEQDLQGLEAALERRRARTRQFFDNIRDVRELPQHHSLDGAFYRQRALELLPDRCEVALDMGTGAGLLLPGLLARADRVIAVDSAVAMLDLARQTAGPLAHRCDLRLGDLEHLPVADGEVDAAVLCMVLHHLPRPVDALREAGRALRYGGHLAIVDLNQHEDESLRERLADLWLGFQPREIRAWLRKLDFAVTGAEVIGDPAALQLITFRGRKP